MQQLAFGTENGRSIVLIEPAVFILLSQHRQLTQTAREAGGVLLGHIRGPHLHILAATEPGHQDRRTRTSFHRRDQVHEQYFLKAREKDPFIAYLGDWHSHPEDTPTPSLLDEREWKILEKHVIRRCVCLIQGRKTMGGYFVLSDGGVVTLEKIGSNIGTEP